MELWVRSQDKTALVKAGVIYIYNKKEIVCSSDYSITELGKYKTQKRALEVLDEIQNILQPIILLKEPKIDVKKDENLMQTLTENIYIQTTQQVEYDLKQAGQFVYTMPKE